MLHNSLRVAISTIAVVVIIVAIILIAAGAGAVYFLYGHTSITSTNFTPTSTSNNSTFHTTTSTNTTTSTTTHSNPATTTITTSSKNSTTTTTSTTTTSKNYALKLVSPGSGALLTSPFTTPQAQTYFPADGPCCGGTQADMVYYTDNGNSWAFQGDLNPGRAWLSADSTGLTVSYETCADASNPLNCGPHHEHQGDAESFNDASLYGDLGNIPSGATVFSVTADIPNHSYYQNCQLDSGNGAPGCSYEVTPYDSAAIALVANGYYLVLSFAETCSSPCNSNTLEVSAYTSQGGASVLGTLNTTYFSSYTPIHKLTISTDRKSYVNLYFDSTLIYSSTAMPVNMNGPISQLELSQRTSINNETDTVTWTNLAVYSSSNVTVENLPAGAVLRVSGGNGFSITHDQTSNGTAVIDVAVEPSNLSVSVSVNGKTATYAATVNSGAVLQLVYQ